MTRQLDSTGLKRLHRTWRRHATGEVGLLPDHVQSPFNVGAILRTAAAFKVDHLWLVGDTASPTNAKTAKTALGSQRYLEWSWYDTVAEAAHGCDVVVATAMSQFVAPSVAERLGIPYHYVLFCPDVVDGLDGRGFTALFKEPLDAHRASIGLAPVTDVGEFMFTTHPLLAADPVLGPWHGGGGLAPVQTGAWTLEDERPLPADLLSFLDGGAEPVYVGFGSMRTVDEGSVRVAVAAIRAHGRRVVIGRGWAGLDVVDGRDDCFVVGEVNHQALFGRVAAVVHHGGAGTTNTAFRAGVPQVVVPQGGDQAYWAGRVVDLTHEVTAGFPVYTGNEPTRRTLASIVPDGFYKQEWTFDEHSGTHMDAPAHFIDGGRHSPDITPEELIVPIVVIDISARVPANADALPTLTSARARAADIDQETSGLKR